MASLTDVLARIPGYGGYTAKRQLNEAEDARDEDRQLSLIRIAELANTRREVLRDRREGETRNAAMRAEIAALPPQMRTREHVLPILLKYAKDAQSVATALPAIAERGEPIGSGGLLKDGKVIPPAARPEAPKPAAETTLAKLMRERAALPPGDQRITVYDAAIKKESETARQITPPTAAGEQPLVSIVGPDGKPILATREQGKGKTPWTGSPDQLALRITGGRESVYVQRMMMGANQAAKDLANVVQLPLTASTGVFGGRKQGAGLLDAGKEVLANKATQQEAQAYNAMATGFQRSLAQIESAGLMPSGALTHQMDAVLFKEGDTNLTKLHKLAQTRQIVEAGMEVIEANPRVSKEEKEKVKLVLDSIRKSVPFTHSDLIRLQVEQEKNPAATLTSVLGQGAGDTPKEGDTGTSKSGKPTVFRNGRWEYK